MGACCAPTRERGDAGRRSLPVPAGGAGATGLVELAAATFRMGADGPDCVPGDGEGPVRAIDVGPFAIGACAVTNAEFASFAAATRYETDAERFGWSFVFRSFVPQGSRVVGVSGEAPWWVAVEGASWRSPAGPGSDWTAQPDHPIVHVSWHDASAFCSWASCRLPTESEWEYAARGGLDGKRYPWGDELRPAGAWQCNIWQGRFPAENSGEDGYVGTAPVRAFEPNGHGLYNTSGNVWEWCADAFGDGESRAVRGGSYLCHDSYCNRYRVSARTHNSPDSSTGHTGFRVARDT